MAFFNKKLKLFVEGRKQTFTQIKEQLKPNKNTIWIHAASLGEFEQGRPIIEELKRKYPECQIVLTFFSPSGYEIRKNYDLVDLVCYLPMDTIFNAKRFVKKVKPNAAIFIKYEFWPNYLIELKRKKIPTFLISGIFRKNQVFFKFYGTWMRRRLKAFHHFFVQDLDSKKLLESIKMNNVTLAGDTRFDRVQKTVELNEKLPFVNDFKASSHMVVAGSTWPEDEQKLVAYINDKSSIDEKFVIAPHNIHKEEIHKLAKSINKPVLLYSEKEGKNLADYQVLIIDTIGLLAKVYAYADVAYIGGGYTKSGVHNTLEAATFGLPIVIGPNYKKFKEVKDLIALKGCVSVSNEKDTGSILHTFYRLDIVKKEKSAITKKYVQDNLGATKIIMNHLSKIVK